jgi:hypothetical protein
VTPWTISQPPENREFTINLTFGDIHVDRRILLKQILRKQNARLWNGFKWL